ncbi:MAG: 6-phosphofructokinase [Myxococcota bacterium]
MRRIGIIFSGGPAPAANAVITSCVMAFRRAGIEVVGFRHGYRGLMAEELVEDRDWFRFENHHLRGLRNRRGIIVGTARANPGKAIRQPADLEDADKSAPLARVHQALTSLGIDALVSIGGEDTLRTANLLHRFQRGLPEEAHRIRVVHLPKTIDNDYRGIDFTFGFFTAVDVLAKELLNLRADAMATSRYFICETMGRKAAWLPYGVAIAGEAHMVIGVEDVMGPLAIEGTTPPDSTSMPCAIALESWSKLAMPRAATTAQSCWPRDWPSCFPRISSPICLAIHTVTSRSAA